MWNDKCKMSDSSPHTPHFTLHTYLNTHFLYSVKLAITYTPFATMFAKKPGFMNCEMKSVNGFAPGGVQNVDGGFERDKVQGVGRKEHDNESDDFGAFFVMALEIPDAVHQVAVDGAENESEKIRKFQVPVEHLVHYPDRGEGNERVHDANQVVFDKMLHVEKYTIRISDFEIRK